MAGNTTAGPSFSNPPLTSVECSVTLKPPSGFLPMHVGVVWEALRDRYPSVRDGGFAPWQMGGDPDDGEVEPFRAAVLAGSDGQWEATVSSHALSVAWRRQPDTSYPRFQRIYNEFSRVAAVFSRTLAGIGLDSPDERGYRLTYTACVQVGVLWTDARDIGTVVPMLGLPPRGPLSDERLLAVRWHGLFALPEQAGMLVADVRQDPPAEDRPASLHLRQSAFGEATSARSRDNWFALAHSFLVGLFVELTSPEAHEFWGRDDGHSG